MARTRAETSGFLQ